MTPIGQNLSEFDRLIEIAQDEGVVSYLEIGARFGGSFERMVSALPTIGRYVAVDLPLPPHGEKSIRMLNKVVDRLKANGWGDTHLIVGDSTDYDTFYAIDKLGPFDLVFIDANHAYPYVKKDWRIYGKLGRMVAFHDINYQGQKKHKINYACDVPALWEELKPYYRHEEIIDLDDRYGIGVLWI